MLLRLLCEDSCSHISGTDQLTFSVIWKIDDNGNTSDEWFGRTIIRSRVRLTYGDAQKIIVNAKHDLFSVGVPEIFDGVDLHQIEEKVVQLNAVAKALRQSLPEWVF